MNKPRFSRSLLSGLLFAAGALTAGASQASITYYGSGTLDTEDGTLICALATCVWGVPSTLSYQVGFDPDVSVNGSSGAWFYSYSWDNEDETTQGALSHFLIEASNGDDPFTASNIASISLTPADGFTGLAIGCDGSSPDDDGTCPEPPGGIYGLKWNRDPDAGDFDDFSVSFYSDRAPMWGDIFIKDGGKGEVVNAGYDDPDPVMTGLYPDFACLGGNCLEMNKTGYDWLAVPDTTGGQPPVVPPLQTVPEPASILLFGAALAGLGVIRRRKIA